MNDTITEINKDTFWGLIREARDACGQDIIARRTTNETQYDDSIVRQMIECIKVHGDGRLTIIFGGGYEIEETL